MDLPAYPGTEHLEVTWPVQQSGLRVSPITLGTMTFGDDWGWGSNAEDSTRILASYVDRGGNSIDTANMYTNGHAEKIIGDYFAGQPSLRDRVVLATKFFCNMYEGDPNGGGPSRKAIVQQLENSLRRLRTDYVDLYWLHNFDPATPVEETLRALDDLVAAGKIRYIGFPTCLRGRPRRRPRSPGCADGRRSSCCNSSTPCSSAPRKAS